MNIRFQQFVAFMLATACLIGSVVAVAAQATPVVVDRCAGAEAYVASFTALTDELEALNQETGLDTNAMEEWAPEDFETYAAAFASIGEEVGKLTPPPAAETAQALMIEFLTLTSDVMTQMGTDGLFVFFLYATQFEQLEVDANAAIWAFEEECKIAWVDDDEDGTLEIGPGNPVIEATPVASPEEGQSTSGESVGTRENPVPMGTPEQIDDWEVTVLSVMPDATDFVVSDDEFFSVEPEEGRQYFVAKISATYTGDTSDTLDAEYRFNVVGESAVAYTWSEDSCGYDVPDAISNSEVFSGGTIEGNLCWSVRSEDADSLVMYDDSAEKTDRIFMALFGEGLGLPGMIDVPIATAEPSVPAPAQAIGINEFYFLPGQLTIAANTEQTIEVTNEGTMSHTFTIDELGVDLALEAGQSGQVTLNVPAGTYQFYCKMPEHKDVGLYGSLLVE